MSEPRKPSPAVPYPNPWVLGQSDTERLLRERLAEFGVRVEFGTALVDFTQDTDAVRAALAGPGGTEYVAAQYLIGADGGAGTVRRTLGIPFEGTTDESIRMLLGDVRVDALDHDFGYWFASADTPTSGVALTLLPGGRLFQFAAPLGDDPRPTRGVLQEQLDRVSGRTDLSVGEPVWSTVWRPNIRLAQRFRSGRVFLAGDAAHVHPPTGGQGMNTCIQDAYNLGWKLAAALVGDPGPLDTYEPERRGVAQRVLGLSTALLGKHLAGHEDAMHRGAETHQLDISYRRTAEAAGLTAGDRAPDAPLRRGDGSALRLFDLFRGPHATRLTFGAPVETTEDTGVRAYSIVAPGHRPGPGQLIAVDGHAFIDYAATPGTRVQVRPDGYLAWHRQG
ncbi:FAD-dependent monooxygenase [Nocardia sp. AB354]|uniref:FAD-dependent monooxygenase n=1 Tax=Nocardia sp. AB354 TaxID=3413283 RepID=UPI003C243432